jgi:hypothetical protein
MSNLMQETTINYLDSHSISFQYSQISKINENHILLKTNIETIQHYNSSIDLTSKRINKCKIILSSMQYEAFKKLQFINNNLNDINFYSYLGGKEITTLTPYKNIFSSIVYPNYTGTLFNSIEFPIIEENDEIFLLIDQYLELNKLYVPELKKTLIKNDVEQLINNIKTNCTLKNIKLKFIISDQLFREIAEINSKINNNNELKSYNIYTEFMKIMTNTNIIVEIISVDKNNIAEYVCDLLFGKLVGNQLQDFSGNIYFPYYEIIDVYTFGDHNILKRSSGLQISKNGKSNLIIILKSNLVGVSLTICENITDKILETISISTEDYISKNILNKLITYINYYETIEYINDINIIKDYMKNNLSLIFEIEFININDITVNDIEWFQNKIKNRFIELIKKFKLRWDKYRQVYFDNLSITNDNYYDKYKTYNLNVPIYREYTCGNDKYDLTESPFTNKLLNKYKN